ncbi:MAG: ABC transporter permease [Anaerolineae bacterium]|nr:ABC transporter permease [Anaerolineae bacterium]MDH7473699.1 ABC transporter permease [Anaerolineae bacterium]
MTFIKRYLIPRLIQYFLVIFLGITAVFIIPRLTPTDPVQRTIAQLRSQGSYLDPASMDQFINDLTELYGLQGSMPEQYIAFWRRLFHGDFGVSFFQFPTPVNRLIARALPWTAGLLLTTTLLSWTIGNIIGGLAGYFSRKRWSQALDFVAMVIRPLPYYIFAFALLLLLVRWFPVAGGTDIGRKAAFNWPFIKDVLRHAFLPALSLTILGGAANFQIMKLIVQNVNSEDFVQYAKLGGVEESRIVSKYVIQNAMLPQITNLALSLGQVFSGALITEIVFSYPGLGTLLYNAIITGDYNLIMGITLLSIVAITTAILIIDLLYPLFDPRVRYL